MVVDLTHAFFSWAQASLSFTSLLSVVADVVLVALVVLYSPIQSTLEERGGFWNAIKGNLVNENLFIGLGVLSSAMACQHSAFIMSNSLRRKTPKKWAMVTFRSISVSLFLTLLLGVAGYLAFLDETKGDILNNFDADSLVANIGRGLLALTMFFTYPMEGTLLRETVEEHYSFLFFYSPSKSLWPGSLCVEARSGATVFRWRLGR